MGISGCLEGVLYKVWQRCILWAAGKMVVCFEAYQGWGRYGASGLNTMVAG